MNAYTETITLVLFMSLSLAITGAETHPPISGRITPGSSLSPLSSVHSSSWVSHSGLFAFGFYSQENGFVIGIWLVGKMSRTTIVWTANRDDPPVTSTAKLQFTVNGKLILTDHQGQEKIIVNANARASSASMLDSGNFVLYDDNNSIIIWQSFDHPTDTLLQGQSLTCGGQLFSSLSEINSSTGRFPLNMQVDGNVVLYPVNTTDSGLDAYWSSGTAQQNVQCPSSLVLNKTGRLHIWHSNSSDYSLNADLNYAEEDQQNTGNPTIYRATLELDGFFRLYVHHANNGSYKSIKKFPESSPCDVKGFCGYNSYCTYNDDKPVCYCLLGYKFIDANKYTLGCERNYSKAECSDDKHGVNSYSMVLMNDIVWNDHSYSNEHTSSEEECSSACLVDCNCWAANYDSDAINCMKQGLPFRYIRRTGKGDNSTTTYLKVGKNSIQSSKGYEKPIAFPIKITSNKAVVHIILVTSVFSIVLCSVVVIFIHYIYKIRVLKYKRLTETWNVGGLNEEVSLRRFTYNELRKATNHFKEELGKGSFGSVYKGALNKGKKLIAVKRLEKLVEEGEREFQAEVKAIGKTHHRNLVRLLGFCAEGSKRLLVYEYMSNGSLGKLLFGDQRRPDWDERVRIALDIARGMLYLHEECEAPIIHCDIKPQNILMDEFWTSKISDFGLAKLLMPDQTRTFTMVRGTRGYMAPEWNKNMPISLKADLYSYGIMLLEILCCRRNLDVNALEPDEILLSSWAYKCFVAGEVNTLVPWEVIDKNVMENMIKVALWCIQDDPLLRPTMKGVVLMLEGITDIAIPPCPDSNPA